MNKVFSFVGWSGCGKTELICRIIEEMTKQNIFVSSLKHSHHNFKIDKEGKDSFKHVKAGTNETIIFNELKWALISKKQDKEVPVKEILRKFSKKTEIILIEGLKNSNFPKIEVIRTSQKKPFLFEKYKNVRALVVDENDLVITKNLPIYNFQDTQRICKFILNYLNYEKK